MGLCPIGKFSGVFIRDATVIKLPDAMACLFKGSGGSSSKSSVKVDLTMDCQGNSWEMTIRQGRSNDLGQEKVKPQKGALYIRDLGYFNIPDFWLIIKEGHIFCLF